MDSPLEMTGGPRGPEPSPWRKLTGLFVAAGAVVVLGTVAAVYHEPIITAIQQSTGYGEQSRVMSGEPATAHGYVEGVVHGDGATMRKYLAASCITNPNAQLCFDSSFDAGFKRFVDANTLTYAYISSVKVGRNTYYEYTITVTSKTTGQTVTYALFLLLNAQGLIADEALVALPVVSANA